ncbi:MAG: hypothetical protein K0R25_392 [Rickettsiaceae bacterium]|jgi:hypothetical protein|nr:hypothetical protein [Rickettsiaceae bacterium]
MPPKESSSAAARPSIEKQLSLKFYKALRANRPDVKITPEQITQPIRIYINSKSINYEAIKEVRDLCSEFLSISKDLTENIDGNFTVKSYAKLCRAQCRYFLANGFDGNGRKSQDYWDLVIESAFDVLEAFQSAFGEKIILDTFCDIVTKIKLNRSTFELGINNINVEKVGPSTDADRLIYDDSWEQDKGNIFERILMLNKEKHGPIFLSEMEKIIILCSSYIDSRLEGEMVKRDITFYEKEILDRAIFLAVLANHCAAFYNLENFAPNVMRGILSTLNHTKFNDLGSSDRNRMILGAKETVEKIEKYFLDTEKYFVIFVNSKEQFIGFNSLLMPLVTSGDFEKVKRAAEIFDNGKKKTASKIVVIKEEEKDERLDVPQSAGLLLEQPQPAPQAPLLPEYQPIIAGQELEELPHVQNLTNQGHYREEKFDAPMNPEVASAMQHSPATFGDFNFGALTYPVNIKAPLFQIGADGRDGRSSRSKGNRTESSRKTVMQPEQQPVAPRDFQGFNFGAPFGGLIGNPENIQKSEEEFGATKGKHVIEPEQELKSDEVAGNDEESAGVAASEQRKIDIEQTPGLLNKAKEDELVLQTPETLQAREEKDWENWSDEKSGEREPEKQEIEEVRIELDDVLSSLAVAATHNSELDAELTEQRKKLAEKDREIEALKATNAAALNEQQAKLREQEKAEKVRMAESGEKQTAKLKKTEDQLKSEQIKVVALQKQFLAQETESTEKQKKSQKEARKREAELVEERARNVELSQKNEELKARELAMQIAAENQKAEGNQKRDELETLKASIAEERRQREEQAVKMNEQNEKLAAKSEGIEKEKDKLERRDKELKQGEDELAIGQELARDFAKRTQEKNQELEKKAISLDKLREELETKEKAWQEFEAEALMKLTKREYAFLEWEDTLERREKSLKAYERLAVERQQTAEMKLLELEEFEKDLEQWEEELGQWEKELQWWSESGIFEQDAKEGQNVEASEEQEEMLREDNVLREQQFKISEQNEKLTARSAEHEKSVQEFSQQMEGERQKLKEERERLEELRAQLKTQEKTIGRFGEVLERKRESLEQQREELQREKAELKNQRVENQMAEENKELGVSRERTRNWESEESIGDSNQSALPLPEQSELPYEPEMSRKTTGEEREEQFAAASDIKSSQISQDRAPYRKRFILYTIPATKEPEEKNTKKAAGTRVRKPFARRLEKESTNDKEMGDQR